MSDDQNTVSCVIMTPILTRLILACCMVNVENMMVSRMWYRVIALYWTSSYKLFALGYMALRGGRMEVLNPTGLFWGRCVSYQGHSKKYPTLLPVDGSLDEKGLCTSIDASIMLTCESTVENMASLETCHLIPQFLSLVESAKASSELWDRLCIVILSYGISSTLAWDHLCLFDCLLVLLRNGVSPNLFIEDSLTVLMMICTCDSKNGACVRLLLDAGANIEDVDTYGTNSLMIACEHGREKCARVLLKAGADVEAVNSEGDNALMLACENENRECVKLLLENDLKLDVQNQDAMTALMLAIRWKGEWMYKDSNEVEGISTVELLLNAGASTHFTDSDGDTALMIASSRCQIDDMRLLLKSEPKVDVDAQNDLKDTALLLTFSRCEHSNKAECAVILLDAGADPNIKDDKGRTFLMCEHVNEDVDFFNVVLGKGADIDAADEDGVTILMNASYDCNHYKVLHALLRAGVDVNAQDVHGNTALMIAIEWGNSTGVRLMVAAAEKNHKPFDFCMQDYIKRLWLTVPYNPNVNINAVDKFGRTALMCASGSSFNRIRRCVEILINAGADIRPCDRSGKTALMFASEIGCEHSVRGVLKAIARGSIDMSARDDRGRTAMFFAIEGGHDECVQLLTDAGCNLVPPNY